MLASLPYWHYIIRIVFNFVSLFTSTHLPCGRLVLSMLASLPYWNYVIRIVFNLVSLFTGTHLQRIAPCGQLVFIYVSKFTLLELCYQDCIQSDFFIYRYAFTANCALRSTGFYLCKQVHLTGIMLSGLYSIWFLY